MPDSLIIEQIIQDLNDYKSELDGVDHMIAIIMNEINKTHDLSDDEYCEHVQTLEYILKDAVQ